MSLPAVVLAAGWSTRMGHPKALTRIGGETAVERIVRACRDAGCPSVTVVAPPRVALPPLEARVVANPDPDAGRTGSLQLALRGDALVWPVDHPLAAAGTARLLLATPGEWVVPTFHGKGGHPVVLRGRAVDITRAAPPHAPLRDALRAIPRVGVPVDDEGILANLDTPEDVRRLGGSRSSGDAPGRGRGIR